MSYGVSERKLLLVAVVSFCSFHDVDVDVMLN